MPDFRKLAIDIFKRTGALIPNSHFCYAKKPDGWYHGSDYLNKDCVYTNPDNVIELCHYMASSAMRLDAEVVVGPTTGGIILSQFTANSLKKLTLKDVSAVFAEEVDIKERIYLPAHRLTFPEINFSSNGEVIIKLDKKGRITVMGIDIKTGTERILKRGYDKIVAGRRCLVVEDIINSGATVIKTITEIRRAGGIAVGVVCLCNRSGGKVTAKTLGVPCLISLIDLDLPMYPEAACPICKKLGIESIRQDLGKGTEFLLRMKANR